ncbi:YraN family protein [Candidatus Sneabacter namystus]|uniref:YraN family protein n=1 Tax=Candidatus Sneabacter namystus TaxID=2601646 RepID=A0A5C0UJN8_9RICK|nr:YraN family protein [Candidatus Sneabacter namystus]
MLGLSRVRLGLIAEYVVILRYILFGYKIVAHRWRLHKRGEIDIIAVRFRTLVFIEVKARSRVSSCNLIHVRQLKRIRRVGEIFLQHYHKKYEGYNVRVDFALVRYVFFASVTCNSWIY